jgi:hypothetical protein
VKLQMSPWWARAEQTLRSAAARYGQLAPGPLLIRGTVAMLGAAGMVAALSGPLRGSPWTYLVIIVLALLPAVRPDLPWATAVELIIVGEWLLIGILYQESRDVPGMLAMAALLYAHHSTCALAATLPVSARLGPGVLVGWLTHTGGVVLATVLLALLGLLALPPDTGHTAVTVSLIGLLAAIGAGVTLAYLLHRRR